MDVNPRQGALGVLVVGFGGPERFEDVRPFIENVVRGRSVPVERIDAVVEQYRQIGGRSPYNELTLKQASSLKSVLQQQGITVEVFVGLLFCRPSIAEALEQMSCKGVKRSVGIIMAPHSTEASHERYQTAVHQAWQTATQSGLKLPAVEFVEPWHTEPLFIEALAERVADELKKVPPADLPGTRIIFTAHSVPQEMSDRSNYAKQIGETAQAVIALMQSKGASASNRTQDDDAFKQVDWAVAYQSRSGSPQQKWLEPDVAACAKEAKIAGKSHIVLSPIGFLVDHVEVLFDLDVLAAGYARELGLTVLRAPTVGQHPKFIDLLAVRVKQIESLYVKA